MKLWSEKNTADTLRNRLRRGHNRLRGYLRYKDERGVFGRFYRLYTCVFYPYLEAINTNFTIEMILEVFT